MTHAVVDPSAWVVTTILRPARIITVCANRRESLFGDIVGDAVRLNQCGVSVKETWETLPIHYPGLTLDAFVIMPNHVHGIVVLTDDAGGIANVGVGVGAGLRPAPTGDANRVEGGAGLRPAPTDHVTRVDEWAGPRPAPTKAHRWRALPEIVRAFKSFSARRINECRAMTGASIWQRNYYEHVVRNESDLNRIRQYIADNPARWADDPDNPAVWTRM